VTVAGFPVEGGSINAPYGLAFDAKGNVFVANTGNANVTEYAPPFTGAPAIDGTQIRIKPHYPHNSRCFQPHLLPL
jgi:DNA-binding beta-propeller fold protein YncE